MCPMPAVFRSIGKMPEILSFFHVQLCKANFAVDMFFFFFKCNAFQQMAHKPIQLLSGNVHARNAKMWANVKRRINCAAQSF